ncbi:putative dna-directed rna polymerase ii subunit rpb1 protein [Phaeoacremonium minimum UCRPA7]|uniref:Putative dna-directed rna polymerase ii subunit rpb1 protein n=1 Tax=Phaeoacremonium minimum (strain UCR-PA7) TaxID=1286976 RepID=R8BHL1_PHAM7|nr:putative dna-directed rna polymerase ii subunit rpb1 protein [Phaeoacremonium minimum UCRPA7]EON98796.1 putative dna-directed rna polymerase ii subunit rpb1 protein [Phaeoacremonium minimum UCRPA7]
MDAHALLKSQGWRGTGHSLHHTDDSIGLARPLLVSRKDNTLGIGRKNHVTSDQWWLNAFDEQLKGLDTSKKGVVVQTVKHTKLDMMAVGTGKYAGAGGLYASFVRGGMLEGTLTLNTTASESTDTTPETEDRPAPVRIETKEERRARKEAKRLRKAQKQARKTASEATSESAKEDSSSTKATETKEERRARKEAKRKRKEEKKRRKEQAG